MSEDVRGPEASRQNVQRRLDRGWVAGVVLIAVGLLILLGQFLGSETFGLFVPLAIAAALLALGINGRRPGLLIGGSILLGVAIGVLMINLPRPRLAGDLAGGVFMLSFAFGWAIIVPLCAAFANRRCGWALVPAAIFAVIGGGLLLGSAGLNVMGIVVPVILIGLGIYLLISWARDIKRSP